MSEDEFKNYDDEGEGTIKEIDPDLLDEAADDTAGDTEDLDDELDGGDEESDEDDELDITDEY